MKRTVFGIATLLLLGATPCVVNAFTAIAWSESGQRGGSVKQAPTKEAAISAAIADCKKNGGGSDCQVFKVTDEPGFVALYASCAKTCGVTAVTGRATAEQARADGKRDCEAYYRNSCQLAQEWEETKGTGKLLAGQRGREPDDTPVVSQASNELLEDLVGKAGKGDAKALQTLTSLADGGSALAQRKLGGLYVFDSDGVKKNPLLAQKYLQMAANQGDSAAAQYIKSLRMLGTIQ